MATSGGPRTEAHGFVAYPMTRERTCGCRTFTGGDKWASGSRVSHLNVGGTAFALGRGVSPEFDVKPLRRTLTGRTGTSGGTLACSPFIPIAWAAPAQS